MSAHAPVLTTNAPSAFSAGKAAGKPTLRHGAPLFSAPALCRGMVLVVASSGKKYRWCGSGRPPGDDSPGAGALRLKNEKAAEHSAALIFNWCPGGDSNSHAIRRYHLKIVCLPIPPPGHSCFCIRKTPTWQVFFSGFFLFLNIGPDKPFAAALSGRFSTERRHGEEAGADRASGNAFWKHQTAPGLKRRLSFPSAFRWKFRCKTGKKKLPPPPKRTSKKSGQTTPQKRPPFRHPARRPTAPSPTG